MVSTRVEISLRNVHVARQNGGKESTQQNTQHNIQQPPITTDVYM